MGKLINTQHNIYEHFSSVAHSYDGLRQTDLKPIMFIRDVLNDDYSIRATDIGCGTGRYSLQFLKYLNIRHLTCIDINKLMLEQASKLLKSAQVSNFSVIRSHAEHIPLSDNSIDCTFTFNAIHHLNLAAFMQEAARFTRNGGSIFIYTRLRSQNAKNIWGRHFPLFFEKEDRLYEINELEQMIKARQSLGIQCMEQFKFSRKASLNQLVNLAINSHYSTFYLYERAAFESALKEFQVNVRRHFSNHEEIEWFDEYTLLVIRKGGVGL